MKGIKGKNPAFQFYVKDWLSDPQLRASSASTRGIWIDILCFMWEAPKKGIMETTSEKLARMTGATMEEICLFFSEVQDLSFCDISVTNNGMSQNSNEDVTLCNRRMWREEKDRRDNKIRQARHRVKRQSNEDVTPSRARLSPTPTPTPKKQKKIIKEIFPKPEWILKEEWADLLESRKAKKLQNTKAALTPFVNQLELAKEKGYSVRQCLDEFIPSRWTRFKAEWMDNVSTRTDGGECNPEEQKRIDKMIEEDRIWREKREREERKADAC